MISMFYAGVLIAFLYVEGSLWIEARYFHHSPRDEDDKYGRMDSYAAGFIVLAVVTAIGFLLGGH